MEFGEDGPCCCTTRGVCKICKNCESCTHEYTTGNYYCCDISWVRLLFLRPRRVNPTDTCRKIRVKHLMQRSR